METKKIKPKEKRRSNEKRKEKSRDAARCRRSRETDIFTELAAELPVSPDQANHLDKASIMRLAIAYLKVRAVVNAIPEPLAKSEPTAEMDEFFLKALDGFMLVLSSNGDMVYLSENVSDYLGVSQMDMMGQSVYEYSHPCDHEELRECLSVKPLENNEKHPCNFFLRLKCTLTNKGRKVNLKSASYKVIHCTGHLMMTRDSNSNKVPSDDEENEDDVERESGACLVVVGCPIPHPSNIEVPLGRHTFLSKHSLNMKFTYADDKLAEYLGWDSSELVGQSIFDFHHALDNPALDKSFKSLFSKGQCETVAYRFLGKKGGFAWVVTQATLIHCSKQQKPLSIVCVNYILSGVECEDEVYSARQLEARGSVNLEQPSGLQQLPGLVNAAPAQLLPVQNPLASVPLPERPRPQAVTASLFHPQKKSSEEEESSKKKIPAPRPVVTTKKIFAPKPELRKDFEVQPQKNPAPPKPTTHLFQGKPILDYSPELQQRNRPQAVTRSLFAPAPPLEQPSRPPPQTATASIFAPRTEDMNKGFLTFSEDHPGLTMLKDEPEDLTHLAPTPGDVCVPLEDTPFLSDMLDEFILSNENYCPLLSPDLPSELRGSELGDSALKETDLGDSLGNRELGESLADSDPFMYRDSPSPCSTTPNLLSPALSKSPERSVDSLCSPSGSGSGGGLSEDEMLMLSISDVLADDELALRAPYIPMSDQDEALQLLISDDMVMWGPAQPPDKKSKWINKEQEPNMSSSLAQLLKTDAKSTKKCNDHGGGLVDPTDVLGQAYKKSTNEDSRQIKVKHAQKRIHTPSASFENENKRIKCEETNSSSLQDRISIANEQTALSARAGSQLLQQLMSQQIPKSRILLGHRDEGSGSGGGGGGGGGTDRTNGTNGGTESPNPRQQSNSVLMNLLVSGCDDIVDPRNIPPLLEQKLSPLTVHLDNQMVPQSPRVVCLDHLSPDTRKQLMNSVPNTKRIESPIPTSMMSFENYDFDPSLLQASDLLRTLDSCLV
ncbi:hypoxia-inducible factor 1-alpha isoform X2 [Cephus cinctus]|uniref:Hypoxia-inducible factor 1-alpha isoform X2 n=1 Tax=Cephus cinctus TaxID=211228 RepID=A0AAJ7FER5_CEPCN|nr:hypoxia-inducible factor 1-alpha isoform X2 [Cephus cinctus]